MRGPPLCRALSLKTLSVKAMSSSQTEIRSFFKKRSVSEAKQEEKKSAAENTEANCEAEEPEAPVKKAKIDSSQDSPPKERAKIGGEKPRDEHITEIKGDLFSSPKSFSLAHCVSEDLRLGKGIAKLFRDKYGGIDAMQRQGVKVGGVAVIRRPGGSAFVYNLVTKEKFWQKPTYDTLRKSLKAMAAHMQANNVRELAMPRIGCGLDGLQWPSVRKIIDEVFKDGGEGGTSSNIRIYSI